MNITREQVVNRLRQANYTYKGKGDRAELWKQRGSTTRVAVTLRDLIPEAHVRIILTQAKITPAEIEDFILHAVKC